MNICDKSTKSYLAEEEEGSSAKQIKILDEPNADGLGPCIDKTIDRAVFFFRKMEQKALFCEAESFGEPFPL